jgi:hypothetical protein
MSKYVSALLCSLLTVMLFVPSNLGAQALEQEEIETLLEDLKRHALTLNIEARIRGAEDATVWNMELSRVTISGKAVRVRLDGENIVVEAVFTPYRARGDNLLLLAEGTTWIDNGQTTKEATTFRSLPIRLGESVFFYPLGDEPLHVDIETEQGVLDLELEIQVVPYSEHTNNQ